MLHNRIYFDEEEEFAKLNFQIWVQEQKRHLGNTTNSETIETRTELAPKSLEIARNISTEIFVNSLLYYINLGTIV